MRPSVLIFLTLLVAAQAKLNLFLSQREVRRLLGLSAELYYVREGVINEYALNFVVPVPANIHDLFFTWQALGDKPLPYSMEVNISNGEALSRPQLNVSSVGLVPTRMQTFRLALPCSGRASAEIDVVFTINVTLFKTARDVTPLVFRRRKICLQEETRRVDKEVTEKEKEKETEKETISNQVLESSTVAVGFYIAIGCACGLIAALLTLTLALYVRNRKRQQHNYMTGLRSSSLGDNHQAAAFLQRVETPDFPAGAGSGSSSKSSCSATFRRTPIYAIPVLTQPQLLNKIDQQQQQQPCYSISTLERPHSVVDVKEKVQELLVDRCSIKLRGVAQEGTFGRLLYAVHVDDHGVEHQVYVKTVTDQASSMQLSMMVQESLNLYGVSHRNISCITALCQSESGPPLLVYSYDGYTNLKRFLNQYKSSTVSSAVSSPSPMTLTTQAIVDMALQTILAMQYLHRKKLLHKDIAARNCLVNDQLKVKLCDTALSRDLFPSDYHCLGDNENRPIKWMALETIACKEYSWASDVWMFGVMLWELTTLAQQPYLEVDPFEMSSYLKDGYRLAQPLNCPDELFAVMAYCWAMSVDDRPSLTQLHAYLHDFYAHLNRYV